MAEASTTEGKCVGRDTRASLLLRLKNSGNGEDFEAAWNEFYEQYAKSIFRWCCGIGVSRRDAPDVTQDVMLRLWHELKTFEYDPEQRFRSWLKTISQRLAIDFCRKHHRLVLADSATLGDLYTSDVVQAKFEQMALLQEAKKRVKEELCQSGDTGRRNWIIFRATTELHRQPSVVAKRLSVKVQLVYVERNRVLNRLRDVIREIYGDE